VADEPKSCTHETLWAHPQRSEVLMVTQRPFDRRRAMTQALRIKIDTTFVDTNNADAHRVSSHNVRIRVRRTGWPKASALTFVPRATSSRATSATTLLTV
jgi:hypothetical protein